MKDTKNVFITDDIRLDNERVPEEYDRGFDGFELTEALDDFLSFVAQDGELRELKPDTEEGKAIRSKAKELEERAEKEGFASVYSEVRDLSRDEWQNVYEEWTDGLSHEEQYSVPMMNALRYFPDFVSFDDEDRYRVSGATCLLHDTERDAWAVGMSGGGMDLAPHLLDTFVQLGSGVPDELASSIRADYAAYVNTERHRQNCNKLAKAYLLEASRNISKVAELYRPIEKTGEHDASKAINDIAKRHIQGLEKALSEYVK